MKSIVYINQSYTQVNALTTNITKAFGQNHLVNDRMESVGMIIAGIICTVMVTNTAGTGNIVLTATGPGGPIIATTNVTGTGVWSCTVLVTTPGQWTFSFNAGGTTNTSPTMVTSDLLAVFYHRNWYVLSTQSVEGNGAVTSQGFAKGWIDCTDIGNTSGASSPIIYGAVAFPISGYGVKISILFQQVYGTAATSTQAEIPLDQLNANNLANAVGSLGFNYTLSSPAQESGNQGLAAGVAVTSVGVNGGTFTKTLAVFASAAIVYEEPDDP